jgi:hypothetical protein
MQIIKNKSFSLWGKYKKVSNFKVIRHNNDNEDFVEKVVVNHQEKVQISQMIAARFLNFGLEI